MIIKQIQNNNHSYDDCIFNRNFLYSRRVVEQKEKFCKYFAPELKRHTLEVPGKHHRNRPSRMSDSEIMTILLLFHTHHFRDLKSFYLGYVCQHMRKEFPHTVSYNRFVERQAQVGLHLLLFLQTCALGKCTGISIIDSTPLVSCHIKREKQHKTMKGWAAKGKCTMGWFYGFKLHLVINDKGEIIQWQLTLGNVDDRAPLKDKLMLRKRSVIETVNDELKNVCQIEHTRHRSVDNFVTNLIAGLIAYNFLPKKPQMNIEIIDKSRLIQLNS